MRIGSGYLKRGFRGDLFIRREGVREDLFSTREGFGGAFFYYKREVQKGKS